MMNMDYNPLEITECTEGTMKEPWEGFFKVDIFPLLVSEDC